MYLFTACLLSFWRWESVLCFHAWRLHIASGPCTFYSIVLRSQESYMFSFSTFFSLFPPLPWFPV
ncbi:hypothetical protein KC19_VG009600 [Ceratodon purpureus]|uniref:Secreted protein n=1 Tax=Ceratodon purpureus TaxID=3225 RepID=A0A8T0HKR9_CERPU|nr:hypothetical protein KC19_VG009600 [Ceratodon purpureus]